MEKDSGITRIRRYPLTAATRARPMPVFPEVGSMSTEPGPMVPAFSASSIIPRAMRSLMLPPGLTLSCLAQTVTRGSKSLLIRTCGVLPMVSRMLSYGMVKIPLFQIE